MLDVWRLHFEVAPLIGTGNQTGRYATFEDDPGFRCEAGALGESRRNGKCLVCFSALVCGCTLDQKSVNR